MALTTRFIDDAQEQRRRRDAHQTWFAETLQNGLAPSQQLDNVLQCCLLGSRLFLQPEAVLCWAHCWLAQYSHYTLAEQDWFGALVQELLYEPVQLQVLCSEIAPLMDVGRQPTLRAPRLLRFCGSGRCCIALEYVLQSLQLGVLNPLAHLQLSANRCFLSRSTEALDGELELSAFLYNTVLSEFYEPSFLLLTLYALHLCGLLYGVSTNEARPPALARHMHTLKPLAHEAIDWDRVQAAHYTNDAQGMQRLQLELAQLHELLSDGDMEEALRRLMVLWSERASYCHEQMRVRSERVLRRWL